MASLLALVPVAAVAANAEVRPIPAAFAPLPIAHDEPGPPVHAQPVPPLVVNEPLGRCEDGLEDSRQAGEHTLAVVGASFTAGVGPGIADRSWAMLLARRLHWNAVVDGVPGAGYVRKGAQGRGPVAAELARIGLPALDPTLVIIQAGHDDIGLPVKTEEKRVTQAIDTIRAEAPKAMIALITVFTTHHKHGHAKRYAPVAAYRTDHAIVSAATAADPGVIIMDPLAQRWTFTRVRGGLHPTTDGSEAIADKVQAALSAHGITPAPPGTISASGPGMCDSGITTELTQPAALLAYVTRSARVIRP